MFDSYPAEVNESLRTPREESGRLAGTRTPNQRLKRPLLYQLSYQPISKARETKGLHPGTQAFCRDFLLDFHNHRTPRQIDVNSRQLRMGDPALNARTGNQLLGNPIDDVLCRIGDGNLPAGRRCSAQEHRTTAFT